MYSSTDNNITNSSGILYPFPPYKHHPHLPQEFTTSSGTSFDLHQDQFFLANSLLPISSQSCDDNKFGHPYFDSNEVKQLPVAASRKDRHSKIYTAQGFRDRRVRLSINVAREFFDLQDLLGFDKASQTLKWLLTKSKTAINDLAKSKCNSISRPSLLSSSNSDYCEGAFDASNNEEKRRKAKEAAMARMSRMKARARARERTKEKICKISERNTSPNQICSHLRLFNEVKSLEMNEEQDSCLLRKLKLREGLHSTNRRLELNPGRMEANSTWDINDGFLANPSFCAISTNMNPNSSGF